MNLRYKNFLLCFFLSLFAFFLQTPVRAQQITRIAIVDMGKVYTTYFRDSRTVRAFEDKTARVRAEVERLTGDLQNLQQKKLEADENDREDLSLTLQKEINKKADFLRDYYRVKMAELEEEKKRLAQSDTFLREVHGIIRNIAEGEGYSLVVDSKDFAGLLWYSPTVDISDLVIERLRQASRSD